MSALQIAVQALFNDKNIATPATFLSHTGVSKVVSVITSSPDVYHNIGESVIESPTLIIEVQIIECPKIAEGDHFVIDGITYAVQGAPRRDSEHLIWEVDCYAS